MKTLEVKLWSVRVKSPSHTTAKGRKKTATYQVRWKVGPRPHGRTFASKALADAFRAKLLVALQNGQPFDVEFGLPDSLIEKHDQISWFEFAPKYVDMKWKSLSAKSRESTVYAVASAIAALVESKPGAPGPASLRRALQQWYLEPSKRSGSTSGRIASTDEEQAGISQDTRPLEVVKALSWLSKNSLPVGAIAETYNARAVLDALALKMDGTIAAADYIRRRRGVLSNMVRYAIECRELSEDPFKTIQWSAPKVAKIVDRRRVPNPSQVEQLLAGVSYVGTWKRAGGRRYVAFFGCLYYAMMRPEEVIGLKEEDCELPDTGWGLIVLHKATPYAGRRWTDDGELHDDKALKARGEGETRSVPIPPVLVRLLKQHVKEFGIGNDGRIFCTEKAGPVTPFAYQRVWKRARHLALPPNRARSSLADVPYDLRHAGISLGLRTTRNPALIAERAGQSVDILMKRYAWALDDDDAAANKAIDEALGSE